MVNVAGWAGVPLASFTSHSIEWLGLQRSFVLPMQLSVLMCDDVLLDPTGHIVYHQTSAGVLDELAHVRSQLLAAEDKARADRRDAMRSKLADAATLAANQIKECNAVISAFLDGKGCLETHYVSVKEVNCGLKFSSSPKELTPGLLSALEKK